MCSQFKISSIYHRLSKPPQDSELAMSELTELEAILSTHLNLNPNPPAQKKKLRVVCVSDTHNSSPFNGQFKVPPGDVLIHAGDMTNQGSHSELRKAVEWIGRCEHEVKIVIAGNHDGVTLDPNFLDSFGSYFHNQVPQSYMENLSLFTSHAARQNGIIYLNHESKKITLKDGRTFTVFGSPWSPRCGLWGFGYDEPQGRQQSIWMDIPLETDILVTHGPPKFHLDGAAASLGCEYLRQVLWTVRPLLHVFGHIHESRGVERVKWDLTSRFVRYKEESVSVVEDPAPESARLFLVDLTKKRGNLIDNDGTRDGRKESCLVNAAVKRPPKKGEGHGTRQKPIVVDLDVGVVNLADDERAVIEPEPEIEGMEVIEEEEE